MQPNSELLLHVNNYSITGVITAYQTYLKLFVTSQKGETKMD